MTSFMDCEFELEHFNDFLIGYGDFVLNDGVILNEMEKIRINEILNAVYKHIHGFWKEKYCAATNKKQYALIFNHGVDIVLQIADGLQAIEMYKEANTKYEMAYEMRKDSAILKKLALNYLKLDNNTTT